MSSNTETDYYDADPDIQVADRADRFALLGVKVLNPETGDPAQFIAFTSRQVDQPGYVEGVERHHRQQAVPTVRVWRDH